MAKRMGEAFEIAVCLNCSHTIYHVYWGNGGNHWSHEDGSLNCYEPVRAAPSPGSIDEVVDE